MNKIRILIADDHAVVRHGLRLVLRQIDDFEVVAEAGNGEDAYNMIFDTVPDVALLDWKMPRIDGIEAAKLIRRDMSSTKVLILSGAPIDDNVLDYLDHIDGFIHKDTNAINLAHAIRAVANGERFLGALMTQALIQHSLRQHEMTVRPNLSKRETEVLTLMATPLTYREMAEQLILAETTIHTYVKRILSKLDQPNRTQAVIAAMRSGLIK